MAAGISAAGLSESTAVCGRPRSSRHRTSRGACARAARPR
jgi:hypothetical protein